MTSILTFLLRLYKWTVSPFLHFICGPACGCRFEPTCSEYAMQAIEVHGAGRGSWLAIKRIFRCHPWGGLGFDPVPAKDSRISNFDSRLDLSTQRLQPLNADAAFPQSRIENLQRGFQPASSIPKSKI